MSVPAQALPAALSLAAVICWGTSDFTGGYAARRSDAFLVTLFAHATGLILMLVLSFSTHAPVPSRASEYWALAAGALGGSALAIFYRALAMGNMGLTAPIAAVLAAALPTAYGMRVEGTPHAAALIGFLLAGLGIWLISRPEGELARPGGLSLAVLAGVGFAGFFISIHRVGDNSAFWSAALSRLGSLLSVAAIVVARRGRPRLDLRDALLALFAGSLDVIGTALFIRADQTGRFDAAVVLTSLYPAITVLLARIFLKERFTRWKTLGILAALAAVPMIALQ